MLFWYFLLLLLCYFRRRLRLLISSPSLIGIATRRFMLLYVFRRADAIDYCRLLYWLFLFHAITVIIAYADASPAFFAMLVFFALPLIAIDAISLLLIFFRLLMPLFSPLSFICCRRYAMIAAPMRTRRCCRLFRRRGHCEHALILQRRYAAMLLMPRHYDLLSPDYCRLPPLTLFSPITPPCFSCCHAAMIAACLLIRAAAEGYFSARALPSRYSPRIDTMLTPFYAAAFSPLPCARTAYAIDCCAADCRLRHHWFCFDVFFAAWLLISPSLILRQMFSYASLCWFFFDLPFIFRFFSPLLDSFAMPAWLPAAYDADIYAISWRFRHAVMACLFSFIFASIYFSRRCRE